MLRSLALGLLLVASVAPLATGDIVISEWMYNGAGPGGTGEYVEFTNAGASAVNMTGWSFDDDSRVPGTVSVSAFGVVAPGESVILTDESAADFAAIWWLSGVKVIGGNTAHLDRNDELNLFNAAGTLVDRLAYGDETYTGTVRALRRSCSVPATDYSAAVVQGGWVLAAEYDWYGSVTSERGELGSPGHVVGYALSDLDTDGDVDLTDLDVFSCCMTGPLTPYDPLPPACPLNPDPEGFIASDLDGDGDVDLADFAEVQPCVSGTGNRADPACGVEFDVTQILLEEDTITVIGGGVMVNGTTATIVSAGTYEVSGTLENGQLAVDSVDAGTVTVVLNGIDVANSTTAPFYVISAAQVEVVLGAGTTNYLTDPATYVYPPGQDEPKAALYSADTLTISGTGTLVVDGNYNDAIASKDALFIAGGTISVTAVDDGIRGKDFLAIDDGSVTVVCGGDGLKADNEEDAALGSILIEDGTIHVTCGGDAVTAAAEVTVTGGAFTVVSGGGHAVTIPTTESAKGIKGVAGVVITGGTFGLDCADDGVHSNGNVAISGGTVNIATNNNTTASYGDAVHADAAVQISGGTITITACYEGIEGATITIANADIHVTSSDDAITADTTVTVNSGTITVVSGGGHLVTIPTTRSAKGIKGLTSVTIGGGTINLDCADDGLHSDGSVTISGGTLTIAVNSSTSASYGDGIHAESSLLVSGGTTTVTTSYEGIESSNITINNGTVRVTSTDDGVNAAGGSGSNNHIYINGGYLVVNAAGDGIDSNGTIAMTGGTVIVNGPTNNGNAAIDYDVSFNISGGFLVAAGSAGMAQGPSTTSTQRSVKINYTATKTAGTLVHIETTATPHTNLITFAPAKQYQSVVFSAPGLTQGTSFDLYRGGTSTGTVLDGLYQGGTYSGGTKTNTFTTTNMVTTVNAP